jgi:peptidyl-prolyl cis-trans isomerase SurA
MRLLFVARSNATLRECVRSETHLIPPICLRLMVLGALAAAYAGTACRPATKTTAAAPVSVDTWAVVDGREISREDVDKSYLRTRDTAQPVSDEETLTAKLSLLDDLILQDILLAKARALNLDMAQTELDTAYTDAKKNMTDDAFQQELTRRGLTPADLREGLRRELLIQKLIAQEVASKIAVTEKEVTDAFNANRAQFNVAEESYHLAQIVVTPARDPQLSNATGDDATTPQQATAKVQMLMERLKAGASFRDLAIGYSEDPQSAPRGGDLGLVSISKLSQAPPALRNAVIGKAPGSVNVASGGGAYTLVLVVSHEKAGQRDLSMPEVRTRITETLRARKEQLLRAAYLAAVRGDANVTNHFARRLLESKGIVPSLQPAVPAGR